VPQDLHFGTRTVWRDRLKTQVSDPTKTIADILDDPGLGGGIRHGASILAEYWGSEHLDKALLVDYALRIGNRTIFKRLGYLLELFDLDAPETIEACRANLSSGLSALDPTVKRKGRIVKRWNLRVNVSFDRNASK
jgi:predicted transcriptional regulator of viral defense system